MKICVFYSCTPMLDNEAISRSKKNQIYLVFHSLIRTFANDSKGFK